MRTRPPFREITEAEMNQLTYEYMKSETELRDSQVPTPKNIEELTAYVDGLLKQQHDYGTCVYAVSMAATAMFNYMASQLGITGFQAGCADLDILRRTRHLEGPFMIVKAEDMLYPQYDILTKVTATMKTWQPWVKEQAIKNLADAAKTNATGSVIEHWEKMSQ
jgi:hypothetical protein